MKDKIFEVAKNHTKNKETATQLTNELCDLLGVSKRFYKVYYNTFADETLEFLIEAVDESSAKYLFYKQGKFTEKANIDRVVNVC
jgi:hypothetical protein